MNLFQQNHIPLARRCAPTDFDQYEGQEHLIGEHKSISMMVERNMVQSMVFYGPPASGKTGLARIIAQKINADFVSVNALNLNSDDIKKLLQKAQDNKQLGKKLVLFIDEIHRLTRPKQDVFLESLESGDIVLIGATTENPYFALQPALRSRILIFEFFPLNHQHLKNILYRALKSDSLLKELNISISSDAEEFLLAHSSDPRNMLTILETAVLTKSVGSNHLTKDDIIAILQKVDTAYDHENAHYNVISAFIKSVRGSDPDAAIYYLALMIESGEDPRFIFRRLLILAVEDIGMAYPEAITVVQSCADAFERIGFPEGRILLSHATTFLAGLPKSNSAYFAIDKAIAHIRAGNVYSIPLHLQDAHYVDAKKLGKGIGYLYPHDYAGNFVKQKYLEHPISFYNPSNSGFEKKIQERLAKLWDERYNVTKDDGKNIK